MANTDSKFELVIKNVWKVYNAYYPTYIRNKKTGEDMGSCVKLSVQFFDDQGNRLKEPIFEEDCYEYAKYTD